jgi:hypothetical protein
MTEIAVTVTIADTYHADYSRDSHSSLRMFRGSIELYAAIRVHRALQPTPPTPAMLFGQAFDLFLLEPERFVDRYATTPEVDRRTTAGKAAWAEYLAVCENERRTPISREDMALCEAMREAVLRSKFGRAMLEKPGAVQQTIEWDDAATGLGLKCRPDKILDSGLLMDLKTAACVAPDSLAKSAASYGYHTQQAMYLDGTGLDDFAFLVVCKDPPHEVVCYRLDEAAVHFGRTVNRDTLIELAERRASGDWSGRWGQMIQTISLPRWAFQ